VAGFTALTYVGQAKIATGRRRVRQHVVHGETSFFAIGVAPYDVRRMERVPFFMLQDY